MCRQEKTAVLSAECVPVCRFPSPSAKLPNLQPEDPTTSPKNAFADRSPSTCTGQVRSDHQGQVGSYLHHGGVVAVAVLLQQPLQPSHSQEREVMLQKILRLAATQTQARTG